MITPPPTVLDLVEARYGDQIERYYDDRSQHNATRPDTADTIKPAVLSLHPTTNAASFNTGGIVATST